MVETVHVQRLLFVSGVLVLWVNSLWGCIFKIQMFSLVTAKSESKQADIAPPSFGIQRWANALVIPSLPPSQPPNTASFCFPIFIQEEMLMARLCFSGKRSHSVAEALTQPWRHGQHQHILAPAKCVGDKIHLKPTAKTSSDPGGLWLRAVTGLHLSPTCSLCFLQVFSCLCSSGEECLQKQGVCPRVCTVKQRSKTQSELETAGNSAERQRKN